MIDLDAIRARNETRKSGWCYDCKHAHNDSDPKADIDALLAEVERLRIVAFRDPMKVERRIAERQSRNRCKQGHDHTYSAPGPMCK